MAHDRDHSHEARIVGISTMCRDRLRCAGSAGTTATEATGTRATNHRHADPSALGWAFIDDIAANSIFVTVEFGYGSAAHATALMADAGHNLSDVLVLC